MSTVHHPINLLFSTLMVCLALIVGPAFATDWSGNIPNGTVWPAGQVQRLTGNATVQEESTLTIQQGAIIKFNLGTSLYINGTLNAVGTSGSPILMTSATDDTGGDTNGDGGATSPGPGSWNKLDIQSSGSASLTWVNLRYGGDASYSSLGNLRINGGNLTFNNGSVQQSDTAGIYMASAEPVISGVSFQDNKQSALRMNVDAQPAISAVSFSNNGVNGVFVDGGTLGLSRIWDDPEAVYLLSGDVTVPEGLTLTIGPGQIIKPNPGIDLYINGSLDANGSLSSPVYFVAATDDSLGGDTNNDADQSTPDIGAWNKIYISDTGSASLDWTHIAHGGDVSYSSIGSLYVNGGNLIFNNGSVKLSDSAGIYMVSTDPTISGVDFQDNVQSAMRMNVDAQPAISAVSYSNNGVNGVYVNGGILSMSRSWDDPEAVYLLSGDVTVPEGRTLTIGPGQIIKPNPGIDLYINGSLDANGSLSSPVYFVAASDDSHGGDTNNDAGLTTPDIGAWNKIYISDTGSTSLDWTHIAHGGDNSHSSVGSLVVDGGNLTFNNGSVQMSDSAGIYMVSADPTVSGVSFQDNSQSAMRMNVDAQPAISAVSYSNNGVNGVFVNGGILSVNRTWDDPEAVYSLSGDVTVPEGLTLTIGPGQIIKPNLGIDLYINGNLDVNGSISSPVYFVAISDDSRGGDTNNDADLSTPDIGAWNKINISDTGSASLDWTHIAHGGDRSFSAPGSLSIHEGSLTFNNGSVQMSDSAGIYMASTEATISGVDFQDNLQAAIRMNVDTQPTISTVNFSNNGINGVYVDGGTMSLSRSWHNPEAVYFLNANVTVPDGMTLTVDAGQIIKPKLGVNLYIDGALITNGTNVSPVIFTASEDDTHGGDTNNDGDSTIAGPGSWSRIRVSATGSATLNYSQISYGGDTSYSAPANLDINGGTAVVRNSIISQSDSRGIYISGTGSLDINNSLLFDQKYSGLETYNTASLTAINNTINNNLNGVRINGSQTTLLNNIISYNSQAGIEVVSGSSSDIQYNDVYNPGASSGNYLGLADLTGTAGNMSSDPIFVNASFGMFHILSSSPAIDSANSNGAPPLDFFDNSRFDDPGVENIGGGTLTYFDMGAIERQEGSDPVNLVIESVSVSPDTGEIGDTVTISWTVRNLGTGPASAPWSDAVFASIDTIWDITDERVDETDQLLTLFPGESYTQSVEARIPPVMPGDLNFIIRADYREQAREVDENNEEIAVVTVDIPIIPLDGQVEATLTAARPERYFQVLLVQDEVFEDSGFPLIVGELSVGLDDQDNQGFNELYLGANRVPSRSISDVRSLVPEPDQTATSFLSGPHTIIVLARAATLPAGDSVMTLSAEIEPFSVTGLTPNSAGSAGKVTIAVDGVSLSPGGTVSLLAEDNSETAAENIVFESSRRVYATFSTLGLAPGEYRVQVSQQLVRFDLDQGEFTAPETVSVSYGEETLTTISTAVLEIVAGGKPEIELVVSLPSRMRAARQFNYTLTYSNTGNLDASGALFVLRGTGGELIDPDMEFANSEDLLLLGTSSTGPAGSLRPGQTETVELLGIAPVSAGQTFTLRAFDASGTDGGPDFDVWISALGHNPEIEPWSDAVANLQSSFGSTFTEFRTALGALATSHHASGGERLHSIRALLNDRIDDALQDQGVFQTATVSEKTSHNVTSEGLSNTQVILPSTTAPENRVDSGNIRRDMTGKVALHGPGTGTAGWPTRVVQHMVFGQAAVLPDCSEESLGYSSKVITATTAAITARAGSLLPLEHMGIWRYAATTNQSEIIHNLGSTASDLFLTTEGTFSFWSVHFKTVIPSVIKIRDEIKASAPVIPNIPDFDMDLKNGDQMIDWAFSQGLSDAATSPFSTPPGQFALASAFGGMQGAAATVKNVKLTDSPKEIIISGLIRYAFVDRYEFDDDDASKGYFDRNFYVQEWCTQGTAAGFDNMVIVEKPFTSRYIKPDPPSPDPASITPDTTGGASGNDSSAVVGSFDPNDKIGPAGSGPLGEGLIEVDEELFYTILFENDPVFASAPAQRVTVIDVLDEHLDMSTFELMGFGFGDTRIEAPAGLQAYETRLDSANMDGSELAVDISASLDTLNRTITWVFDSIDPDTGGAPTGIDDGFLPVNDDSKRGEGYVTFRIRPVPGTAVGSKIFNDADIFFDQNAPIVTPTTEHTIFINYAIFADGFE